MKIKTYLPIFNGFYGSILSDLEDKKQASELFTQAIEETINDDIKCKVKFEALVSPRFYNFSNDEIHVEINISQKEFKYLFKYCLDQQEEFTEYLESRFTSCDGFTSFYYNNLAGWERYMYEFKDYKESKQGVILSSLLDFYLKYVFEYSEEDLLEYAVQNGAMQLEY